MKSGDAFACSRLSCRLSAAVCVKRQILAAGEGRAEGTSILSSSYATQFATCRACPQGKRIAELLGDVAVKIVSADTKTAGKQHAAKLRRGGLRGSAGRARKREPLAAEAGGDL